MTANGEKQSHLNIYDYLQTPRGQIEIARGTVRKRGEDKFAPDADPTVTIYEGPADLTMGDRRLSIHFPSAGNENGRKHR